MRPLTSLMVALLTLPAHALATTVIHVYQGNSIQAAIDTAEAGNEEICVHPGTYAENIELLSGIDVYSSNGSDTTIIAGDSTWTRTVFANQISYMPSTFFAGFTIEGGKGYGMYLYNCGRVHCEDLVFKCDADTAALYDFHSAYSTFECITINGPSGARSGLEVEGSSNAEYDSITVRGIEKRGISVRGTHDRCFNHVSVESCGTGIYIRDTEATAFNGGTVSDCTTGFEAYTPNTHWETTKLDVAGIVVSDCGTGFSTTAESNLDSVIVAVDTCTVADCTDGMILDRSWGFVKHTDFEGIEDIGIVITEGRRVVIGAPADSNTFTDIDGVGILADSGAVVTIGKNEFTDVLGSAIVVETENDSTDVSYCEMDGSGGCYEGIATSGSGTMARIRECDIYDYAAHQSPEPRGITVYGATAHLGEGTKDYGNSSFVNNGLDLSYQTRAATPDTIKAEYNWWEEVPPDTSEFGGRKAYIDYDPYLTKTPGRLPARGEPCELPTVTRLTSACPNPSTGSVRLQYWMRAGGNLELGVHDLDGRRVRTLFKGETAAGPGSVVWDGCDETLSPCASGLYLIRMTSRSGTDTGRFVLVR